MRLLQILRRHAWSAAFWAVAVALSLRLIAITAKNAVNVLFYDQWDLWEPMFRSAGGWELFRWQHGPHREGAGYLVIWAVARLTDWDTRAECFAICATVIVTFLVYTAMWRRLRPGRSAWDLALPALALTSYQWETLVVTPNPAHGSVSALLVALLAWVWLHPSSLRRDLGLLAVNFVAIYTGFAVFVGLLTPAFLAVEAFHAGNRTGRREAMGKLMAVLVAIVSLATFFVGYRVNPANPTFALWHSRPSEYLIYVTWMFGHATWFGMNLPRDYAAVGTVVLVGMTVAASWELTRWIRTEDPRARTIAFLCGFTLIFAFQTAYGRVSFGLESAYSSRYVIYLVPGLIGLVLAIERLPWRPVHLRGAACVFVVAWVLNAAFYQPPEQASDREYWTGGKRRWLQAYRTSGDLAEADRLSGFTIYPDPTHEHIRKHMQFLKQHHLNLFNDDPR